jgi:hypothetical protein
MTNRIQIDDSLWGDERGLLAAARAILPFLDSLVGPAAAGLSQRITSLLAAAGRGEDVAGPLRSALAEHQETADFVTDVLADAPHYRLPPELRAESSAPHGLRGIRLPQRESHLGLDWLEERQWAEAELPDSLPADGGAVAETRDAGQRFFLADLEDQPTPLKKDEWFTIAFSVGPWTGTAFARSAWPEETLEPAYQGTDVLELTVQLDSDDFEINDRTAILRVPRTGRSHGKARFDVAARHDGRCKLAATVHCNGNFVHEMDLSIPVGGAGGEVEVSTRGRPVNSAVTLEPRPIGIRLEPAPAGGFECVTWGSVSKYAKLPISTTELGLAAEAARKALLDVVETVHNGGYVFQDQIDVPAEVRDSALRILAPAGARLFQQLFLHPPKSPDALAIGEWLRGYAMAPGRELTIQILAPEAPLPWGLLYLGDVSDETALDWNNFLGMRHIVEQLPVQMCDGASDSRIDSDPELDVSLNVNLSIDASLPAPLVAGHLKRWTDTATARSGLKLISRSTTTEVRRALAGHDASEQVIYFYCHATAGGQGNRDPDAAAIIMGRGDQVTLAELNLYAPTTTELAGNPLVFINACESADMSPLFYNGFVPYFMDKGARGVIGTECKTPVLFAISWADAFFSEFLDGATVGEIVLKLRQDFLREHGNPLGLIYAVHCSTDTRIAPALARAQAREDLCRFASWTPRSPTTWCCSAATGASDPRRTGACSARR